MNGPSLRSGHVAGLVLLSVLGVSTCRSKAQSFVPHNQSDLPDAPSSVARMSDTPKNLSIFGKTSSSYLLPDNNQRVWWMSSSRNPIQNRPTVDLSSLHYENTRMAELLRRNEHPLLRARAGWLMFDPGYGQVHPRTTHSTDDWQYYAHHIPVAGPVVLRVGQKAQAHPRVAIVFKLIQPQF